MELVSEKDLTVVEWLLDSDPSIRWQVMHDLTKEPGDVVAAEHGAVAVRCVNDVPVGERIGRFRRVHNPRA